MTLAALLLVSCSSTPEKADSQQIQAADQQAIADGVPEGLRAQYVDLLTQGERQYVLNAMKIGLSAERYGHPDLAKRVFDQAIRRVQSLQDGEKQAERAKSKFVPDEEKWFKGESYERAALYFYRGILYAMDGDYGNAAACAKRVQLEDIASKEQDSGDWYSAEWLLAFASLKQNDPGTATDALNRAAKFFSKQGDVPAPHADDNVLILAEAGHAPYKVAIGQYHEKLTFVPGECRTARIDVSTVVPNAAQTPPQLVPAAENLYVQASTRGPRKVDYVLNGKAEFKADTQAAAIGAVAAGAAVAGTSHNNTQTAVGLGLVAAGLITEAFSASTHPEADTRMWDNLPNSLFLYSLKCPVGTTKVVVRALTADGKVLREQSYDVVINPQQNLTLLWISQLP